MELMGALEKSQSELASILSEKNKLKIIIVSQKLWGPSFAFHLCNCLGKYTSFSYSVLVWD